MINICKNCKLSIYNHGSLQFYTKSWCQLGDAVNAFEAMDNLEYLEYLSARENDNTIPK